jgi:integrase
MSTFAFNLHRFVRAHEKLVATWPSGTLCPPNWSAIGSRLEPLQLKQAASGVRNWVLWKERFQWPGPIGTGASIDQFVQDKVARLRARRELHSQLSALKRALDILRWPEASAKDVLEAHLGRFAHVAGRRSRRVAVVAKPYGWAQLKPLLECVDLHNPREVRDATIALVVYECVARSEEIFGHSRDDRPQVAPIQAMDFRRQRDGSATLRLAGLGDRRLAWLSPLAAGWVERTMAAMPDHNRALFVSFQGLPMSLTTWSASIRMLTRRAGLSAQVGAFRVIREGVVHDLWQAGCSLEDIRQFGGWSQMAPVLRLLGPVRRIEHPASHLATAHGRLRASPAQATSHAVAG